MTNIQLNNLTLKHLTKECQTLVNGFINKIQTLENGWLKIKVHTKQGDKTFVITQNCFFISNKALNAKQNPGGFSAFLKKYLFNQRIVSIEQHGLDRIVLIEFPEKILVLELFAKGNIILCEKDYKILKAFKKEQWKDRTLAKDEKYKFPSSKGKNPLEMGEKEFLEKLKQNKKTIFGATLDILNVAPTILDNIFEKLGLDKKKNAEDEWEKGKKILKLVKDTYSIKESQIYLSNGILYSIETSTHKEKEFESINSALSDLLLEEKKELIFEKKETKTKDREEKYLEQIKIFEQKEINYKEIGEKIYLEYAKINEILETIKKGKGKGLSAKEVMKKINSVNPIIKELDFDKNKVIIEL